MIVKLVLTVKMVMMVLTILMVLMVLMVRDKWLWLKISIKVKAMRFPPKSYNKDLESAEDRREREAQVKFARLSWKTLEWFIANFTIKGSVRDKYSMVILLILLLSVSSIKRKWVGGIIWVNLGGSRFQERGQFIWHFLTLHLVQAAFGSKNWDGRLKCCMQPPIVALYPDHKNWDRRSLTSLKIQDFAVKPKTTSTCSDQSKIFTKCAHWATSPVKPQKS